MTDSPEEQAMRAAAKAARKVIAQSRNRKTALGQMKPGRVAFHVAWASVQAYRASWDAYLNTRYGTDRKGREPE
jgi:hypothetical protein